MAKLNDVAPLAFPILVGDIGGTNVRFSILPDAHGEPKVFPPIATADHPDIAEAIEAAVLSRTSLMPRSAAIALAGPIEGEEIDLTNAPWIVRPREVMERLGLDDVVLLNDFEALALALTALPPPTLHPIGGGRPHPNGARVVVGPGTGLGVAGLVHAGSRWVPVPGEGGHVTLGPQGADERAIFEVLEREHSRVSAETVLGGAGIVRLHAASCEVAGEVSDLATPETVTDAALSGDEAARRTMLLYCKLLGRLAGDLALIFMATGGAYVGGGIAPRILPLLEEGGFREAFEDKAPHTAILREIPTNVITAERPALAGIAAFARTPSRFSVSLDGRRWR